MYAVWSFLSTSLLLWQMVPWAPFFSREISVSLKPSETQLLMQHEVKPSVFEAWNVACCQIELPLVHVKFIHASLSMCEMKSYSQLLIIAES